MKRELNHQGVLLGILIVIAAAGPGCRSAPRAESPTTGICQLHPGIHGRPRTDAAIHLAWNSPDTFAPQDKSAGFHAGKYAAQWAELFVIPNEGILLAPVAGVAGALYGTVGHLVANPRLLAALPSDFASGQIVHERFKTFIDARADTRQGQAASTAGPLVLEFKVRQESLALRADTFGRFEFVAALTGRLHDSNGAKTYVDLWALERSAAYPMTHWNSLSADQWREVILIIENALADRVIGELDRWLRPSITTTAAFSPKTFS